MQRTEQNTQHTVHEGTALVPERIVEDVDAVQEGRDLQHSALVEGYILKSHVPILAFLFNFVQSIAYGVFCVFGDETGLQLLRLSKVASCHWHGQ